MTNLTSPNKCSCCLRTTKKFKEMVMDGNDNHEFNDCCKQNCHHWFCCDCLEDFYQDGYYTCPTCKENIYHLVSFYSNFHQGEEEYEHRDEMDSIIHQNDLLKKEINKYRDEINVLEKENNELKKSLTPHHISVEE